MPPTTTEVKLEGEVSLAKEKLNEVRKHIVFAKNKLEQLFTIQIEHQIECDNKAEELRRFRLMYPKLCKEQQE